MKPKPWMHTAGIICCGILKLLWYLFLIGLGVLILFFMIALEASKPSNNKNC